MRKFLLFDMHLMSLFCGILSGMYMFEYFAQLFGARTAIYNILQYFVIFENLIVENHQHTITIANRVCSNNFLYCSLVFIVLALVIPMLHQPINWLCDHMDNIIAFFKRVKNSIQRFFINRNVVKNFSKSKIYYISLKLVLKNQTTTDNEKNIPLVLQKAYESFNTVFEGQKNIEISVKDDKLILISKDFKKIDETFIEFMKQVQKISRANTEAQILTNAYFVLDVLEDKTFDEKDIEFIEKVYKYDYKNKVIVTPFFAEKYKAEINGRFEATSLGVVRIYKNDIVKQEDADIFEENVQDNEYEDYEFLVFARKKSSSKK